MKRIATLMITTLFSINASAVDRDECYKHFEKGKTALEQSKFMGGPGVAILGGIVGLICPPCIVHQLIAGVASAAVADSRHIDARNHLEEFERCKNQLPKKDKEQIEKEVSKEIERLQNEKDTIKDSLDDLHLDANYGEPGFGKLWTYIPGQQIDLSALAPSQGVLELEKEIRQIKNKKPKWMQ